MARTSRTPSRHPAQREDIERWMTEEKGVQWTFAADVPIEKFDMEKSLRNQARINQVLNEERLETYVEAMKRGDVFPAVVVYVVDGKYVAIDGNHRIKAAEAAEKPLSAYVLDKATKSTVIIQMTYEANAKHGLPNSVEDRQLHAVYLIRSGATSQENAAAALNLSKAQVTRAWGKAKADDRAHDTGLLPRQWASFPPAARVRLGAIRTDEGFAAMADLAWRAQLDTTEIDKCVVELNRSRSAAEQKKKVEGFKSLYRDRIQASGGGEVKIKGRPTQGPKMYYMAGLGQLINVEERIEGIIELIQDAEIEEITQKSKEAAAVILRVIDGLEAKQKGE